MLIAPEAIPVGAPALDPAPGRDRERVGTPCGYGDGGETCDGMERMQHNNSVLFTKFPSLFQPCVSGIDQI